MTRQRGTPTDARGQGKDEEILRRKLEIRGRVQGVGFRPFVYGLAKRFGLTGHVGNDEQGVFIEIEGPPDMVSAFCDRLSAESPPLARIDDIVHSDLVPRLKPGFSIVPSRPGGRRAAAVTPDTATCPDCLAELFDPADRRYHYAFINCTNCGPRYSIIRGIPYDRAATTMAAFDMCPACKAEFESPENRRFHAQPNACHDCGPRAWLAEPDGKRISGDPFALCAERIRNGGIAAIKGLGGFHLACRADSDSAVNLLRERKGREAKPLALMAPTLEAAGRIVHLDDAAAALLESQARPIVLLPRRTDAPVSDSVAPGSACLGIMLPYTPLHALLLAEDPGVLVMTSGNPSDEPLCHGNDEALQRLRGLADVFLLHDRDIERSIDDSVIICDGTAGEFVPLRRARGYVPDPVPVGVPSTVPVLALGGELKSAICILSGGRALLSEHLGELHNPAAFRNFVRAVERFRELMDVEPGAVACDMHPGYAATIYARKYAGQEGLPVIEVQHHHAHVAACAAENEIEGPVIGLACDGTGYGTDGTVWGCEILVCEDGRFTRAGHLDTFPLPGGDAAAVETWRPAAGMLYETYGPDWTDRCVRFRSGAGSDMLGLVEKRLTRGSKLPRTSSLGRLFDGTAALLGICDRNRFEAEAPMALEAAAWRCTEKDTKGAGALSFGTTVGGNGPVKIDFRPLIRGLVEGRLQGRPRSALALTFHDALAEALADAVIETARWTRIRNVALTGGCFANRLLSIRLRQRLIAEDLKVHEHRLVPPGDGGIALGQAVIAAHLLTERI